MQIIKKLFNTYSMKGYCIIYFEHRNDVTSIVKLCLENTSRRRVFSVELDYACAVMCASEEPLQYIGNQNIHVARHLYILSRDNTIDLMI